MPAVVHDQPECSSILGLPPSYSFHDLAEITAEAPIAYEMARADMRERRMRLGEAWYRRNEELARAAWAAHRPWWL